MKLLLNGVLLVHPTQEWQVQHSSTMAWIYDGMELSTIWERPNYGCIDLIVDNRSRGLVIQWAERFIVAVDLIAGIVPLLQTMAREMEHQRISCLNTLHKPMHCHSDVMLCWTPVNISFFICNWMNSSVKSCRWIFILSFQTKIPFELTSRKCWIFLQAFKKSIQTSLNSVCY